jgi:hypothetical protein
VLPPSAIHFLDRRSLAFSSVASLTPQLATAYDTALHGRIPPAALHPSNITIHLSQQHLILIILDNRPI